jgi:hypothetical protein
MSANNFYVIAPMIGNKRRCSVVSYFARHESIRFLLQELCPAEKSVSCLVGYQSVVVEPAHQTDSGYRQPQEELRSGGSQPGLGGGHQARTGSIILDFLGDCSFIGSPTSA